MVAMDKEKKNFRARCVGTLKSNIGLACKNNKDSNLCDKIKIKCIAFIETGLDFTKCPILKEGVKEANT